MISHEKLAELIFIPNEASTMHSINELKDHCDGLGAIIKRLKNLSDNDEPYELMKHFIDSLDQQWKEINHEATLESIVCFYRSKPLD